MTATPTTRGDHGRRPTGPAHRVTVTVRPARLRLSTRVSLRTLALGVAAAVAAWTMR